MVSRETYKMFHVKHFYKERIMTILLLQTTDDMRKLTKSYRMIASMQGTVKEDCDVLNPSIDIDARNSVGWSSANYAYIAEFGRFYFIRDMIVQSNDIVTLVMHVDVLMTYNANIRGLYTLVLRQEHINNPYIIDDQMLIRTERILSHHEIGSLGNPSSQNIALTVTGGN